MDPYRSSRYVKRAPARRYFSNSPYYYGVPIYHYDPTREIRRPFHPMQQRPGESMSAPKAVRIPVKFSGSYSNRRSDSALKIQKLFRGFLVRKSVRKIKEFKVQVDEIEAMLSRSEVVKMIRENERERLRMSENLMNLLLKLDGIQVLDLGVRVCRKGVIRKAIELQERIDSIISAPPVDLTTTDADTVDRKIESSENSVEFGEMLDNSRGEIDGSNSVGVDDEGIEIERNNMKRSEETKVIDAGVVCDLKGRELPCIDKDYETSERNDIDKWVAGDEGAEDENVDGNERKLELLESPDDDDGEMDAERNDVKGSEETKVMDAGVDCDVKGSELPCTGKDYETRGRDDIDKWVAGEDEAEDEKVDGNERKLELLKSPDDDDDGEMEVERNDVKGSEETKVIDAGVDCDVKGSELPCIVKDYETSGKDDIDKWVAGEDEAEDEKVDGNERRLELLESHDDDDGEMEVERANGDTEALDVGNACEVKEIEETPKNVDSGEDERENVKNMLIGNDEKKVDEGIEIERDDVNGIEETKVINAGVVCDVNGDENSGKDVIDGREEVEGNDGSVDGDKWNLEVLESFDDNRGMLCDLAVENEEVDAEYFDGGVACEVKASEVTPCIEKWSSKNLESGEDEGENVKKIDVGNGGQKDEIDVIETGDERKRKDGEEEGSLSNRKMMENIMEENAKMMIMMTQLFESNEVQLRMLNALANRVEFLEKMHLCGKLRNRRKKKKTKLLQLFV